MLDFYPDMENMTREQLESYRAALLQKLVELDSQEPEDMEDPSYEDWADEHEELEDLLDELQDRLEN